MSKLTPVTLADEVEGAFRFYLRYFTRHRYLTQTEMLEQLADDYGASKKDVYTVHLWVLWLGFILPSGVAVAILIFASSIVIQSAGVFLFLLCIVFTPLLVVRYFAKVGVLSRQK
jgi:hypothetical protein